MHHIETHLKRSDLLEPSDRILVAVSGGMDSVVLAHAMHNSGFNIGIAHVNFHLRDAESDADEAFVHLLAQSVGVPFHLHHAHYNNKGNLQDWARNERYAFFNQLKVTYGYNKTATGHHKDDQVETVLHNLIRGTGIRGVRGMMANRNGLVRPFLNLSKSEIASYLKDNHLSYKQDSSNSSTKYVRNKIRHSLIPLIGEIGENSLEKLHTSISHLQEDSLALSACVNSLIHDDDLGLRINLDGFEISEASTLLYHAIQSYGFNRHQCLDLMRGEAGAIIETDAYQATKSGLNVLIRKRHLEIPAISINGQGSYNQLSHSLVVEQREYIEKEMPTYPSKVWMDSEKVQFPLEWKTPDAHEKFRPLGATYDVEIAKYLKDRGIDRLTRKNYSVLYDAVGNVIWVPGVQLDDSVKCTSSTKTVIALELS